MAKTKSKAKKPAKKGAKGGAKAKKSAKKSAPKAKKPAKKAPAKKPAAKKAPAKKPAKKAPAKKPAKQPVEAPPMEAPVAVDEGWSDDDGGDEGGGGPEGGGVQGGGNGHGHGGDIEGGSDVGDLEGAGEDGEDYAASEGPRLADLTGRAMIVQILGDAEAYFFDFQKLSPARRRELVEHHADAYDRRKRSEGKPNWTEELVPVALLGESMPPAIRERFDLSAPHEGLVLWHAPSGALLYAASKDDDKLAILAPDLATISPQESFVDDVFDPERQSYAYTVDRTESAGFTLGEIETLMQTAGAQLTLV